MSAVWLTIEEVLALLECTSRHVQRLVADGKVESRTSDRRSRNGRICKEFLLSSLPERARAKFLDGKSVRAAQAKKETPLPSPLALALGTAPLFDGQPAIAAATAVQKPLRVALTPKAEKEAARRIAILEPLLDYLANPHTRSRYHQLALTSGEPVASSDSLSLYLAQQHSVSRSTIWNWKRRLDQQGSMALARKPRSDKNRSTWAAQHRDLADLAALVHMGNHEQPGQSVTVAHEAVCERAQAMGIVPPSYQTVRAFLGNPAEVSPSMLMHGRHGRKKYDAQFAPWMGRAYTEPANAIWVSDHMIHDVFCQNDVFGKRDLSHIRIRMTTILDYRSRFVVGAAWCEEGSSHSIGRALLRALLRFGLPRNFYCDNGKDYRKVARGLMPRLGVPVTFCLPFHPQSKHIERYHRTAHERFDKRFSAYTAGAAHLRPDAATAALARHGVLLQMGRAQDSQLPLASEFTAMCLDWIENEYNQRPQTGQGMDGRSPADVFLAERGPHRPCPDSGALAMLLCDRTTRKVQNCAVELEGARFVPDLSDHAASVQMHELSGRRVEIAYDPLDPMFTAVLDEDGNFLCRLQREDLMRFAGADDDSAEAEETRSKVGAFIANRNGLAKAVRQSTAELNRRVMAGGYTTLEEESRQRLELPRAVGDNRAVVMQDNIVQRPQRPVEDHGVKQTHSEDNAARYFERMGGVARKGDAHGAL